MGIITHGLTRRHYPWHPLYATWSTMKQRCANPRDRSYRHYGGRGIRVCDRWARSFTDFVDDMGPRPDGYSIDRINNDGNYEPANCRWATLQEQARNRPPLFTHRTPEEQAESRRRQRETSIRINATRKSPPKICQQCGREYTHRQGYTAEWHKPKFCSPQCYWANKRQPDRICQACGIAFHPKRRVRTAKFCSKPCFWSAKRSGLVA